MYPVCVAHQDDLLIQVDMSILDSLTGIVSNRKTLPDLLALKMLLPYHVYQHVLKIVMPIIYHKN